MPIYEYVCKQCDKKFEALVRASTTVACPSCKGTALEKQLSVFKQGTPALTSTPMSQSELAACGMCGDPGGPGACSLD
jgi:putative FmdB family regulatory protein